jgi:uncharacterized protein (DUF433 family)
MDAEILGQGIYTFSEAARLTGVRRQRIRAWFLGVPNRPGPVIQSSLGSDAIGFAGLIDTLVVGRLRDAGVSLQYIRKVHDTLIREFQMPHPFCRKALLTDGKAIWVETADEFGEWKLKEILTRQHAFPSVLRECLEQIEYDDGTLLAKQWNVHDRVIINPKIKYGKPVIGTVGIPTAILAAGYRANGKDAVAVANWYDVTPEDVLAAVHFEAQLGARAA